PLIALLGLMHLGITRLGGVLGRGRRTDDRGVDNRAGRYLQSLIRQVPVHLVEQLTAQIVLLEQVAEAAHRGLVRHRLTTQVDAFCRASLSLDHAYGPRISRVYRDEQLVEERGELLQAWADYCDGSSADVIKLPVRNRKAS